LKPRDHRTPADVCMILEGSYPYVAGGVSHWTHDLILAQEHLSFHLLVLLAPNSDRTPRYELPENVTGVTHVVLQKVTRGARRVPHQARLMEQIEPAIRGLTSNGGLEDLQELLRIISPMRDRLGEEVLLNSKHAWEQFLRIYRQDFPDSSFLDYFWTLRGLLGGLYAVLLGPMPRARVYHSVSTGYAGLYLARAHLETGRPGILTEHGIYTNERRIEIAMADWLHEDNTLQGLAIDQERRDLRDLWMHSFTSYSRACYAASDAILTLFEGNQSFQLQDGADPAKMAIIPNGIDFERYSAVERVENRRPTVALIGRVVPIKDVKTYIRAIAQVREVIPEVDAYLLGPYDEDPGYYEECRRLVAHEHLENTFTFAGRVPLNEWLGRIDLIVLTSISEGQPLVILEAGAAGVPCVATNVGACQEMIMGDSREEPPLGPAGEVVPLSNPSATARAIIRLLDNPQKLAACSHAARERVRLYYNKKDLDRTYRDLYERYRNQETGPILAGEAA